MQDKYKKLIRNLCEKNYAASDAVLEEILSEKLQRGIRRLIVQEQMVNKSPVIRKRNKGNSKKTFSKKSFL